MTVTIDFVITNSGDGANGIHWVTDDAVIEQMQGLCDNGDETYASGDGLQVTTLKFPKGFDLDGWLKLNQIEVTTLEDVT